MPTKISDLPVGVAGDLDADARFVFDDLTSGTTKQVSAAVMAEVFAGEPGPPGPSGGSEVRKTIVSAAVDLSAGTSQTIGSVSIADIAAGDIIEVDVFVVRLNDSGNVRSLTWSVSVGDFNIVLAETASASSSNRAGRSWQLRVAVVSDALALAVAKHTLVNGAAEGVLGNGGNTNGLWQDEAVDITGTRTVSIAAQFSDAGTNQSVGPLIAVVKHIVATG